MANKTLTPVDEFSDAKSPVNGDSDDMALDEDCHQRAANRTEYLYRRGVLGTESAGSATEPWSATTVGSAYTSTSWGEVAGLTKALSGNSLKEGAVILAIATINAQCAAVDDRCGLRIAVSENGGAYASIGDGGEVAGQDGAHRTIVGLHEVTSDLSSLSIRVEGKVVAGGDSMQCYTPTQLKIVKLCKFIP